MQPQMRRPARVLMPVSVGSMVLAVAVMFGIQVLLDIETGSGAFFALWLAIWVIFAALPVVVVAAVLGRRQRDATDR